MFCDKIFLSCCKVWRSYSINSILILWHVWVLSKISWGRFVQKRLNMFEQNFGHIN